MQEVPQAVRELFEKCMADWERDRMDRETRQAKADPAKHRLTRVCEGRWGYRFFRAPSIGGAKVAYCYSTVKNVAGYYLSWRERIAEVGAGRRDEWQAHKTRRHAKHMAQWKAEQAMTPTV